MDVADAGSAIMVGDLGGSKDGDGCREASSFDGGISLRMRPFSLVELYWWEEDMYFITVDIVMELGPHFYLIKCEYEYEHL